MKNRFARTAFTVVFCLLLAAPMAFAQASRTWVSGVGDDANPCSRTAPCKTFAGAISKTAAGGEISVLDPAGYGAVTITKPITINGAGTLGSILGAGSNAIVVNIQDPHPPDSVVVLRDLQLNGFQTGFSGVRVIQGTVVIENLLINGFNTGVDLANSYAGNTTVSNSTFVNNRLFALHAQGGTLTVEGSLISSNQVGVQSTGAATVRLSNSGFYNNKTGFGCGGGVLASAGNNRKAGNVGGVVPVCAPTVAVTVQ
jgi:hypothetical protein